ncbi:hypothetical protein Clocl_3773 [Acetivibrio clariflavus DSM 19732]|uniref:Uncharacterized protein n=1 Tax=Acetivibrio clariflavus (strain DSM 19732 / NBRC 101661 / EBR45) TaxID=720554 RepID=G8M0Y2_ACECE|nr:hypothetical protein Clocl_3773 [Acetivibrio clariflavus DSM 19732]
MPLFGLWSSFYMLLLINPIITLFPDLKFRFSAIGILKSALSPQRKHIVETLCIHTVFACNYNFLKLLQFSSFNYNIIFELFSVYVRKCFIICLTNKLFLTKSCKFIVNPIEEFLIPLLNSGCYCILSAQ